MADEAVKKKNKKNNTLKYIMVFVIFFAIGLATGLYATDKFLGSKQVDESQEKTKKTVDVKDITNDEDYKDTIDELYNYLNKDVVFYNSTGFDISKASNEVKLRLVYNYIIKNKLDTTATLDQISVGATTCQNNFVVDVGGEPNLPAINSSVCTISKISTTLVTDIYKKLFGDENIQANINFNPTATKSCVINGSEYFCGNILNTTGITGDLESNFEITKVTKDDKTIQIFEKGYLVDKRSNIANPNDGYDNYYLHSSDSKEYYYELKSSDNLTFKHTFNVNDDGTYYYSKTEVVK